MKHNWITRMGAVLLAAVVAVTTAAPAFAEEEDGEGTATTIPTVSVSLSQSAITLDPKEDETLNATVSTTNLSEDAKIEVSWKLDEDASTDVITLGESVTTGKESSLKVTAQSAGKVTVIVTATAQEADGQPYTSKEVYCEITVKGVGLTGENLIDGKLSLIKGESVTLTATPYGEIGTATNATWSSDSPSIAFVSSAGTVTAQNVGETKIHVEIGNYSAECTVTVTEDKDSIIETSMGNQPTLPLSNLLEELKSMCKKKLGDDQTLSYLMGLFVLPEQGNLYYRYTSTENTGSGVGSTERYYLNPSSGQRGFSQVSFVPNPEYTGTVSIQFAGYSVTNNFFTGIIRLDVEGVADVSYSGVAGEPVTFQAADFSAVYKNVTGDSLRYVTFELPSVVQGTLYYNYLATNLYNQAVTAGTSYYRDRSPQIDQVSFVPRQGTSGTVTIAYHAYGSSGTDVHNGQILISVSGAGEDDTVTLGDVTYTAGESGVTFRGEDFNTACKNSTGASLNYVQFTPPTTGGRLYYDYKGTNEKVVDGDTAYYLNTSPMVSKLTFVPDSGTSTVQIPFLGVSTTGQLVKGTVKIQANMPASSAIRYSGNALPLTFSRSDFEKACQAMLKTDLAYLKFTKLPDESYGTLYQGYESSSAKGSLVTEDTQCFLKDKDDKVKNITFVAKAGFQGRTTLSYTGYDTQGKSFTGTVEVYIADYYGVSHFTDMGNWKWAQPAVEFLYTMNIVSGVSATKFGPGERMKRGDFTLMLCKAFGFDTGNTVSFSDVPQNSYYAWAVATAKDLGIVVGDETGRFQPESGLLRQDAMVMLQKAMKVAGMDVPTGSYSSLIGFVDREKVSTYARNAVGAMVEMGIVMGDDQKRLNPKQNLNRAEMATILHHILTL